MLAAHGNVCNVQKEVAIQSAFGLMTNSMQELVEKQALETLLYRVLRDYRYLLVEQLYKTFNATNNIHSIVSVSNALSKKIGVEEITDPNASEWNLPNDWRNTVDKKYFEEFYTVPRIVTYLNSMIKEKKLPYQQIISKFEQLIQKAPIPTTSANKDVKASEYVYAFLHNAIDMDSGDIKFPYMCWFLSHFGVVKTFTGDSIAEQRSKQLQDKKLIQ